MSEEHSQDLSAGLLVRVGGTSSCPGHFESSGGSAPVAFEKRWVNTKCLAREPERFAV